MTDKERLVQVEKEIDAAEQAYAEECAELYKKKGFDSYAKKWQKKIDKLADKYSRILFPLKSEHDDLRYAIAEAEEEERKKQFKDMGY